MSKIRLARNTFIAIFAATLMAGTDYLLADQFRVDRSGNTALAPPTDKDVCKAYLANLNSLADSSNLECARPVNPQFTDFRKPQWTVLNPLEHAALARKFDEALRAKPNPYADEAGWLARFKERVEKNEVSLSVARIDIDNDGVAEHLVRYERGGRCDGSSPARVKYSGASIFVVNEAMTELRGPSRNGTFLLPGVRYDAFIFRGRPYFDFISRAEGPNKLKLVVQQIGRASRPVPVCVYDYQPANK